MTPCPAHIPNPVRATVVVKHGNDHQLYPGWAAAAATDEQIIAALKEQLPYYLLGESYSVVHHEEDHYTAPATTAPAAH